MQVLSCFDCGIYGQGTPTSSVIVPSRSVGIQTSQSSQSETTRTIEDGPENPRSGPRPILRRSKREIQDVPGVWASRPKSSSRRRPSIYTGIQLSNQPNVGSSRGSSFILGDSLSNISLQTPPNSFRGLHVEEFNLPGLADAFCVYALGPRPTEEDVQGQSPVLQRNVSTRRVLQECVQ